MVVVKMFSKIVSVAVLSLAVQAAQAGIVILGTRVVYPAEQKSITVNLKNVGDAPALVQAWLDNGDEKVDPATLKLPFIIMPPVMRVEGNTGQSLRIRYTGSPLPQDRESLFYFNVLDVPPKPKAGDSGSQNYLQFSVRSRLKFFYRPARLPYDVVDAYAKVVWTVSGSKLIAKNPTPYYITYSDIQLKNQDKISQEVQETNMVAPFSEQTFALNQAVGNANQVEWTVINDYGGYYSNVSPLQR